MALANRRGGWLGGSQWGRGCVESNVTSAESVRRLRIDPALTAIAVHWATQGPRQRWGRGERPGGRLWGWGPSEGCVPTLTRVSRRRGPPGRPGALAAGHAAGAARLASPPPPPGRGAAEPRGSGGREPAHKGEGLRPGDPSRRPTLGRGGGRSAGGGDAGSGARRSGAGGGRPGRTAGRGARGRNAAEVRGARAAPCRASPRRAAPRRARRKRLRAPRRSHRCGGQAGAGPRRAVPRRASPCRRTGPGRGAGSRSPRSRLAVTWLTAAASEKTRRAAAEQRGARAGGGAVRGNFFLRPPPLAPP